MNQPDSIANKSKRSNEENTSDSPAADNPDVGSGGGRIIFWLIFLYALGFALMVVEDILSHIFI